MSYPATNWAVRQKGLRPATKIVLWHLCDRHNPEHGCFPKQETLANDCEMSRSTLNLHLDILEKRGLIRRDAGRDKATKQQRPTRYYFAFEGEITASRKQTLSISENQTQALNTVSEKTQKQCPKNREPLVRNSDSNLVSEPLRKPVSKVRNELTSILSPATADGFIEHLKAKRVVLTVQAAKLIAKKLMGHPNPDAVVEKTIMNNWTGIFPEKSQKSSTASPKRTWALDPGKFNEDGSYSK